MATHSSTLVWKIPWTEEPARLQSMGSLSQTRLNTSLSLFTFMHWRRKWQSAPALLPGKSHGRKSLIGYSPWGCKELDTTERPHFTSPLRLEPPSYDVLFEYVLLEHMFDLNLV